MKKSLAFAAVAALFLSLASTPSQAKSYTIGDDRPIAVIVVPDSWKTEEIEDGIESTSPDSNVYIAAEAVEIKNVEEVTKEAIKYFLEQGITLDESTMKQSETKIGGMPAVDISWKGKDKDGPTNVGLTFVIVSEQDSVLLYFWGNDEGIKMNEPALRLIADSIKAVPK